MSFYLLTYLLTCLLAYLVLRHIALVFRYTKETLRIIHAALAKFSLKATAVNL